MVTAIVTGAGKGAVGRDGIDIDRIHESRICVAAMMRNDTNDTPRKHVIIIY